MAMYLGEDKVASLGSICNVLGNASKNLYDKNNVYIEGASNQNAGNKILVLPNTTYTFSIGKYTYGEVKEFDNSGVQINDIGGSESSKIITFTTSSNAKYITTLFFTGTYNNVSLSEIDFTQIQLELGSTATSYEEYYEPIISIKDSKGDYHEVPYMTGKVSKNLFNKDTMVEFKNGYRLYTDGTFNNNSSFYGLKIPVQPNTTYTSSSNLTDTNLWSDLCFFDKGMNFISGVEGRTNKTFTTPTNCYFVTYAIYNQYQWFQLEKGSNATEYEKYYDPTISIRNSNGIFQEVDINEDNYSLEEQVVGTYLGKLLCKKTFEVTSPSQTSSSEIILTLASGCDITKYEGMLKTSNNDKYQLNAWFSSTDYIYSYVLDSNKLKLRVSHTSYVSRPIEVTVWYTKN